MCLRLSLATTHRSLVCCINVSHVCVTPSVTKGQWGTRPGSAYCTQTSNHEPCVDSYLIIRVNLPLRKVTFRDELFLWPKRLDGVGRVDSFVPFHTLSDLASHIKCYTLSGYVYVHNGLSESQSMVTRAHIVVKRTHQFFDCFVVSVLRSWGTS